MSGWQNFGCMDLKQVRIILRQTKIRDKGNAQTNPSQIDEQIITGKLDFRDKVQLLLLKQTVKKLAGHAVFIQHQKGIAQEFFQPQRFVL